MSDASTLQATIDDAVATFNQFIADVEVEIAALVAANPGIDVSKLAAVTAAAKAADPGPGATPTP